MPSDSKVWMKRRSVSVVEDLHKIAKRVSAPHSVTGIATYSGEIPHCPKSIIALDRVLPAGQAFRWKKLPGGNDGSAVWRGVVGKLLFDLSQNGDAIKVFAQSSLVNAIEPSEVIETLKQYFNLQVDYGSQLSEWTKKDVNFQSNSLDKDGARVLAIEPTEALFSYICSSNNNIPRISKMVNNLAEFYGCKVATVEGMDYHTFPRPSDLIGEDVEKRLRAAGFGYRAGFIVKTARKIEELGGESWLNNLKEPSVSYEEASQKLLLLPGVGRKVADCVSLVGLGKFESVPVDTHVFQIADKLYEIPALQALKKNKSKKPTAKPNMTNLLYNDISSYFRNLWGPYAGWAQQILFTQRVLDRHSSSS